MIYCIVMYVCMVYCIVMYVCMVYCIVMYVCMVYCSVMYVVMVAGDIGCDCVTASEADSALLCHSACQP